MNQKLKLIGSQILNSLTRLQELSSGKTYFNFLEEIAAEEGQKLLPERNYETVLQGGVALSPGQAIDCAKEYIRTVRFVKGTYHAVQELLSRFPGEKLNILYAGTGPYASIILPVLALLPENSIQVTLLDINPYSIKVVNQIISKLGLNSFVADTIVANAITYRKPEGQKLHLIISETMFRALLREPQAAITVNLAPQLTTGGILIPEEIEVQLACSFFSKEAYFQHDNKLNASVYYNENSENRREIDTLLRINQTIDFQNKTLIQSKWYKIPEIEINSPDLCLFTKVKIFEDIELSDSESTITNPECITAISTIADADYIRLSYDFKNIPLWKYELK